MGDCQLRAAHAAGNQPRQYFSRVTVKTGSEITSPVRKWCTSREFWFVWTRAQLTTADSLAA